MATIIQWRRDTAANWTTVDPVLANGEAGYETDTNKLKLGDGTTVWSLLPYWDGGVSGGIVETIVPGNDIAVDDTDPANPIVSYIGSGGVQQDPPFPYKPEGEPVVLVLTGQSNAVGATTQPAQPFPPNPRVFDWTTGGSGTVYSFQSPDLNAPQRPDFNDQLVYTGMPLGGRGNIGWSAANRIQELTGRDVYVICVALNAEPIQGWYAGERMAVELNLQVPAALAAVPNGPTGIDGFLWMQGEANLSFDPVNYMPPKEYADNFLDLVYDQFVTEGWIIDRQTQVGICEFSPGWGTLATIFWQIQYQANEFFRVVSSYDLPVVGDNIHFTPYGLAQLGEIGANGFLAGPDPKLKNPEAYLEDLWNVSLPAPEQNQILYYNALDEQWEAKTSTSPLGIIEFDYRWSTSTAATPSSGQIRSNNADPSLATLIYVNEVSAPGNDLGLFWDNLDIGDWLNINAPGDYDTRINFDVTGQVTKAGDVYTVPVTLFEDLGYRPGNNNQVSVFLRFTETQDGLPAGGTDGQMIYKVGADDYSAAWDDPPFSVQSVVAGTNVTVDNTDPANPIVSAVGGGGSGYWAPGADPNDIFNTNSGKVCIGTNTPVALSGPKRLLTMESDYARTAIVDSVNLGVDTIALHEFYDSARIRTGYVGTVAGAMTVHSQNGPVDIYSVDIKRMTIDADGNVGIGTETTAGKLHVKADTTQGVPLVLETDSNGNDACNIDFLNDAAPLNGNTRIGARGADFAFFTGSAERMRIAGGGNVGIGIDNPLAKLHVDQIIRLSRSGTQAGMQLVRLTGTDITGILSGDELARIDLRGGFDTTTTTGARVSGVASENWTPTSNPSDLIFSTTKSGETTPSEAMRINSDGTVDVGSTLTANVLGAQGDCYIEGQYFITGGTPLVSGATKFEVVAALPGTPDPNTIYFVTT